MNRFDKLEAAVDGLRSAQRPRVEEYQGRSRMEDRKQRRAASQAQRRWLTMPFDFFDAYGSADAAQAAAEAFATAADAVVLSAAEDYADAGDVSTLASANGYTDTEIAALSTVYQPLDSDLTAIAALSTTAFGRGLLVLANAGALQTAASMDAVINVTANYAVGGTQVVGAQEAAVADATGAGDVVAQLNTLLSRLRAHGLIAT